MRELKLFPMDDEKISKYANIIEDASSTDLDSSEVLANKQVSNEHALHINDGSALKRYWGNNFVFCFIRSEPFFTLGPHCNPAQC